MKHALLLFLLAGLAAQSCTSLKYKMRNKSNIGLDFDYKRAADSIKHYFIDNNEPIMRRVVSVIKINNLIHISFDTRLGSDVILLLDSNYRIVKRGYHMIVL